jgi:hypothetical protein
LFLSHTPGSDYVYLPGSAGNYVSFDLDLTGDVYVEVDLIHDNTAASYEEIFSDRSGNTGEFVLRYAAAATSVSVIWFVGGVAVTPTAVVHGMVSGQRYTLGVSRENTWGVSTGSSSSWMM